jgi:hypothetical protein
VVSHISRKTSEIWGTRPFMRELEHRSCNLHLSVDALLRLVAIVFQVCHPDRANAIRVTRWCPVQILVTDCG